MQKFSAFLSWPALLAFCLLCHASSLLFVCLIYFLNSTLLLKAFAERPQNWSPSTLWFAVCIAGELMEIDIEIKNQQSCADRDFQGRQRSRRIRSRASTAGVVQGEFQSKSV